METCDVLIVGGGPAGSTCASALKSAGLDVLVLDKAAFPRNKPCAGWITPQVFQSLKLDVSHYASSHVCQPIKGFRCGIIGQHEVEVSYDHVVSYGIRRCEFDAHLLNRSGARCQTEICVTSVERQGTTWSVNRQYAAPMIVGAGGHFCPVARALGARKKHTKFTIFAQEAEFRLPNSDRLGIQVKAEVPELFFFPDLSGYGWCFRKGAYMNIGLGRTVAAGLAEQVTIFCHFLHGRGKVVGDIPARFLGHAYQLYQAPSSRLCSDGILLIGDAASLAYPQSGEGIRPAVESGLIAADVIIKAGGQYEAQQLRAYQDRLDQRLGEGLPRNATGWLPSRFLHYAAGRLLAMPWFTRRYVLDRWFLHAEQKALVL